MRPRSQIKIIGVKSLPVVIAGALFAGTGFSQIPDPVSFQNKLEFHAETAFGTEALGYSAVYAGFLQEINSPREWGQGGLGYARRFGSTLAYSGIRNALGLGLDTALREDPRYQPSEQKGFWTRAKHAFHGTLFSRKDSGGESVAYWRLGSAYGATFLSNAWYPSRLDTMKLGMAQGSAQIGFDLLSNLGSEFWPDVKKKLLHRTP